MSRPPVASACPVPVAAEGGQVLAAVVDRVLVVGGVVLQAAPELDEWLDEQAHGVGGVVVGLNGWFLFTAAGAGIGVARS
jgi:hypothetical protein